MDAPSISPEVAAHVAKYLDLQSIEVPPKDRGFLVLRPRRPETRERAQVVGRVLAEITGALVVITGEDEVDFSVLDEDLMRALGWVRADGC